MWRHHTMWCQTIWRQNVASAENAASPHNVAPKCGVTGKCGVTKQCGAKMWRHGQMWRHQTMWRQTMWRQNVASRGNGVSPNNLAPNNVAPKCGVTGKCGVITQCGAKQCGATMWRHRTMRRHQTMWRQRMWRHMSGKCVFIMCLQRQVEKCVLFCQHRVTLDDLGKKLLLDLKEPWLPPGSYAIDPAKPHRKSSNSCALKNGGFVSVTPWLGSLGQEGNGGSTGQPNDSRLQDAPQVCAVHHWGALGWPITLRITSPSGWDWALKHQRLI